MLETDYLIVGAGATGMAFADIILSESDASMIIVDKFPKPSGHWNLAYSFVTLHQPSSFYGVSSTELGTNGIDEVGFNKGLRNLASGAAINAYYDDIMRYKFLPSGRVKFFPLCEYTGDGKFKSILTGESYQVQVNKKTVFANHMQTKVPANHTPEFKIAPEVKFIPINNLPRVTAPPFGFVVIGGGKTGIDACLWLLEQNVNPDKITWIKPRDTWLNDRRNLQQNEENFKYFLNDQASQFEALEHATSIADLFDRLEKAGVLVRIDKNVKPTMFRGATISQIELEQLRRIKNVVRMGRVKQIEKDKIVLEKGTVPTTPGQIFIDCSANALIHGTPKPVFSGNTITPQVVRHTQILLSAAFIAHVELAYSDEKYKNEICKVIPLPNRDIDWITMLAVTMTNQHNWRKDPELTKWLYNNRLDGFSRLMANVSPEDEEKLAILKRLHTSIKPGLLKLQKFVTELTTPSALFTDDKTDKQEKFKKEFTKSRNELT